MALKKIQVAEIAEAKPKSSSKKKPQIVVKNEVVKKLLTAIETRKNAEAVEKELRSTVTEPGLSCLFLYNIDHPLEPVSSVEVIDESGSTALVIQQDRYGVVDENVVVDAFEKLHVDVNLCVVERVVAKFDSDVFMVNGEFSPERYMAFSKVINETAARLGVATPLSSEKKVTNRENFHSIRWSIEGLKTVSAQKAVQDILPAVVAVKTIKIEDKVIPVVNKENVSESSPLMEHKDTVIPVVEELHAPTPEMVGVK